MEDYLEKLMGVYGGIQVILSKAEHTKWSASLRVGSGNGKSLIILSCGGYDTMLEVLCRVEEMLKEGRDAD